MPETNPLLAEPSAGQRQLLELVWDAFRTHQTWPIFQYVEGQLGTDGLDALAVLESFPMIGAPGVRPNYRAVWFQQAGNAAPPPDSPVALTIAGLQHLTGGADAVHTVLKVVDLMVERLRTTHYSPTELVDVTMTRDELAKADHLLAANDTMEQLRHLLARELILPRPQSPEGNWQVILHPELRRLSGVRDIADYLDRITAYLQPEPSAPRSLHLSPLALPESLDYLDAVWRLRFGTSLLTLPGANRTVRLSLDVNSVEAFQAATSALSEVMAGLQIPHVPGVNRSHALGRLAPYLKAEVPGLNEDRIDQAVVLLDAIREVRNGLQHMNATQRAINGLGVLGIKYPITDWSGAWDQLRVQTMAALDAIRDEIRVGPPHG